MKIYTIIGGVNGVGKSSLTGVLAAENNDLGVILLHQLTNENLCEEPVPQDKEENRRNMRIFQGFLTT